MIFIRLRDTKSSELIEVECPTEIIKKTIGGGWEILVQIHFNKTYFIFLHSGLCLYSTAASKQH